MFFPEKLQDTRVAPLLNARDLASCLRGKVVKVSSDNTVRQYLSDREWSDLEAVNSNLVEYTLQFIEIIKKWDLQCDKVAYLKEKLLEIQPHLHALVTTNKSVEEFLREQSGAEGGDSAEPQQPNAQAAPPGGAQFNFGPSTTFSGVSFANNQNIKEQNFTFTNK